MSYYINKNQATVHDKSGLPVYGIDKDLVRISTQSSLTHFQPREIFTQISYKNFRLIDMNNNHRPNRPENKPPNTIQRRKRKLDDGLKP